ncbi:MAG TPA: flagellar biosynthesis protein FlhB [Chloroflexota bacterium]|nr:flagellar biosynthesis protein FlhB [Chloroflexota bacterium]
MPADDKTEAPTPKRRKELRDKGQVARSPEVGTAVSFLMSWLALRSFGQPAVTALRDMFAFSFQNIKQPDVTVTGLMHMGLGEALLFGKVVLPFSGLLALSGVIVNIVQVGFHVSPKALRPDVSRINPITGAKRFFSIRSLFELVKSLAKIAIVGFVAFKALSDHLVALANLTGGDIKNGLAMAGDIGLELLLKVGLAFLVLSVADFMFQRWQFEKSIKMTKQEIKEESRSAELNEHIRGRIRTLQRQMSRQRMMQRVPLADVIITNPTHYAVALKYDSSKMAAPRVVAKGQRLIAQQIKDIARAHGIPLVENKPLAQALFRAVDVDREIPRELYKAVAEVLAFIYRLKNQRMAS